MKHPKLTNEKEELVLRKEAWINLIFGFPAIILVVISLLRHDGAQQFLRTNIWAAVVGVLIVVLAIYFLIASSLDRRIKFVINTDGIWIHNKGLLAWNNIHYYYFEEITTENNTDFLFKIKLLNSKKEIKINISLFNVSEQQIEAAIAHNSGDNKVISLKEIY